MTRYTIDNVNQAQTVFISERDVDRYEFSYNNDRIQQCDIDNVVYNSELEDGVKPGESLSFSLISDAGGGAYPFNGALWHLNLLAINGEYINLPTTYNVGDSATTELSTGESVTIELLDDKSDYRNFLLYDIDNYQNAKCYEYKIIITNIYHDLEISEGNFKSAERSELILKQIEGVNEITGWDFRNEEWLEGSLNTVYLQTDTDVGTGNEFYFSLLEGYTNPQVTVISNGHTKNINVELVSEMGNVSGGIDPNRYEYRFNIDNKDAEINGDNIEIYITAEKEIYTVQYDTNGDGIVDQKDSIAYTIFEGENNELILPEEPEYDKRQFVFEGWEYNGKLYKPNDIFSFNKDTVKDIVDGTITFTAKLTPIEQTNYISYNVQYLLQSEDDGEYYSDEEYPGYTSNGTVGSPVFLYNAIIMYVEGYVLDAENSDIIHILTEGDNDLVVRFKIDKNGDGIPDEDQKLTIMFNEGEHGSIADEAKEPIALQHVNAYPAAPEVTADEGWVFTGWNPVYPGTDATVEIAEDAEATTQEYVAQYKADGNGDGIPDEDQDLNKPEDSDSNKDSEKADGEDTAAATNVGIFASLATSALAGLGILTVLKKRRKN